MVKSEEINEIKLPWKGVIIGIVIVILLWSSVYIISAGERGVLLTLGKPEQEAKGEGLHFKIPFVQKIVKMNVQTQKYEADLTAASADLQDVNTKIAINYHVVPELVPEIYTKIGVGYADKVIYPLEQEANKATTAQFTAEELVTRREEVREQMKTTLTEKLRDRGIVIEDVSIVNFAFGETFSQAIESKVTAEQLRLKAATDLERIKLEAQAIRLQREQLSVEYLRFKELELQSKALDKWNGVLPQVTGGAVPFINLDAQKTEQK